MILGFSMEEPLRRLSVPSGVRGNETLVQFVASVTWFLEV